MSRRIAIVTGSSGGIGSAIAALFAREGWAVVGIDREKPNGDATLDEFVEIDISDAGAIESHLGRFADEPVDVLVNNAAVNLARPLVETVVTDWDRVMNVNVRAAYVCMRVLYPALARSGGAVVNVSSVHAVATSRDVAAYAASKGALSALTRATALEFAPAGVRVNAVLPGAVNTQMLRTGVERRPAGQSEDDALRALAEETPLRRIGKPEEIAQAILFLADASRSGFMTGQSLIVDGGATARLSTE